MFKTELHLHSAEVSDCGRAYVNDIVDVYERNKYSTVVLCNHMSEFTYKSKRNGASLDMTWDEKVDFYLDGYYKLKEAAKGKFNVLLGMELRFYNSLNDYLVYGVTENFLRSNGDLMALKNVKELRPIINEYGLLLFQAHPFRNNIQVTEPQFLDGVEAFNGHPGHDSRNDIANMWADKFHLLKSSGSDFHFPEQTPNAGILTPSEIKDNESLVQTLKNGQFLLITGQ